jgi:hypothetical protein
VAHFDNSTNNKYNPDPTKAVKWGDQTWEEMMIGWMSFVYDSPPPATKATGDKIRALMPPRSTKRSNRFLLILSLLCFVVVTETSSHEPVTTKIRFNKEIVRIFQDHCLACHQPGSNTKVFLHNYASARPWAKAIKEEVLERRMPPSQAVKGFGQFEDDYGLTQHEVDQIVAWVDGGTPKGDDKDLPPDRVRPRRKKRMIRA